MEGELAIHHDTFKMEKLAFNKMTMDVAKLFNSAIVYIINASTKSPY